jgi:hypothetical protein
MFTKPFKLCVPLIAILVAASLHLRARELSFGPGDVFVSLEPGPVQWFGPDGTLRRVLVPTVTGYGEGMAFDASGNLHVTRWCLDGSCDTGNAVEKFNVLGQSMGAVASNFNCNPHTILFDAAGDAYVGQTGCNRTILKFVQSSIDPPLEYAVAEENQGVFWMDLAPDGCTMFYTSVGPNVKRFDVCTNTQLPDFNAGPLPGSFTHDLRVLPDGGVLVSNAHLITRLDALGVVTQTYEVPGEGALWAGLDLADNNTTFWAGNYYSSNVHKFSLADGTRVGGFNAGTPPNSVVGIRVMR